ncbi:MAG: M20/M25/M40 family metallo-hydrolase [Chitinophagaceae bacterium]
MRLFSLKALIAILLLSACSSPKNVVKPDTTTLDNLRSHIQYLADDKLEGRRTGTPGEKLAMDYISHTFEKYGLQPKGENGYIQPFEVYDGRIMDTATKLSINKELLLPEKDYFVFPFSANEKIEALPSIAVQEADMPWFFDLKETLEENKNNPHFDLVDYIRNNCKKAKDRGASAVILYNSSSLDDKLVFDSKDRSATLPLPVLYVKREAAQKFFKDQTATLEIKLNTAIAEKRRTGHNVIGYIDNGSPSTIVLGAHFDHLGYGEDGNSRNTSHESAIHNGADDNASGTAALLELARILKAGQDKHYNFLFIAFSGEELGLFGSKHFTEHPTINLSTVDCMINMDMVGRLNDSTHVLTIGGYGTSPAWSEIIRPDYFSSPNDNKKTPPSLVIKIDSSGTGPSDHTSFYRKDIPVLFYFTGLHTDYHKPTDDADKINYTGEQTVIQHIQYVIGALEKQPKLAFLKTRETQTTTSARFSVTMGIMPDYTYDGSGVRADGVSEGKPAQKAGLRAGDIILSIGDYKVSSMESYMQTLGKFKKGDKVKVKFKRGSEEKETLVEF